MPQNQENEDKKTTEDLDEQSDDTSKDKSNDDADDKGDDVKWGFGDIFKEEAEEDDEGEDSDDSEENDDKGPTEAELLRQEVSDMRAQMRLKDDMEKLKSKYGGKEGFPEVNQKQISDFMSKEFSKIPPAELGFIMANFSEIVKGQKNAALKAAKDEYSPEAIKTARQQETQDVSNEAFKAMGEQLKKKFGIKREQSN